jgi:hypothetical protein
MNIVVVTDKTILQGTIKKLLTFGKIGIYAKGRNGGF